MFSFEMTRGRRNLYSLGYGVARRYRGPSNLYDKLFVLYSYTRAYEKSPTPYRDSSTWKLGESVAMQYRTADAGDEQKNSILKAL